MNLTSGPITCAQCDGSKDECVCPEPQTPVEAFQIYCELTPWASECKIYED